MFGLIASLLGNNANLPLLYDRIITGLKLDVSEWFFYLYAAILLIRAKGLVKQASAMFDNSLFNF